MAGVGKSTVGKLLALDLGFSFIDLDVYIYERDGMKSQKIIDAGGDELLLSIERKRMQEIELENHVVAPGGSIVYHPDIMVYLKQRTTLVYLQDTLERIANREQKRNTGGVVGLQSKTFKEVLEERIPLFEKYADMTVSVTEKNPHQIVREIKQNIVSI